MEQLSLAGLEDSVNLLVTGVHGFSEVSTDKVSTSLALSVTYRISTGTLRCSTSGRPRMRSWTPTQSCRPAATRTSLTCTPGGWSRRSTTTAPAAGFLRLSLLQKRDSLLLLTSGQK